MKPYKKELNMKKAYISVLGIFMVLLALTAIGCKSSGEKRIENNANFPSFVSSPPSDNDYLFGIGSSILSDTGRAREQADSQARTDIALQLDVQVQAMIVDYYRSAGTVSNQAAELAFYESVSRQLTQANLSGVQVVSREQTADGRVWTLSRLNKADAARAAAEILETEASRFAEFKAGEALRMMEAQLNGR